MNFNLVRLENFGSNFSFIKSVKKSFASRYSKVVPIEADTTAIKIPYHFPKTNPENNKIGDANPKSKYQTIENKKNIIVRNRKLLFL